MSDESPPEHKLAERWVDHATTEIDMDGIQNTKALLFEIQQAVDRLANLESLSNDPTDDQQAAIDEMLDTLGSLLLQYHAAHHDQESIMEAIEQTTDADSDSGQTDTTVEDTEVNEGVVRERIEGLIHQQGVSQVSRVADIIMKEFDAIDRNEVIQIAAEVRTEAGEMDTLGDPDDYTKQSGGGQID